jgi:selenocysteine-specific elongation factor
MPEVGVIVATAGHVDHGKTSLIRALTQVDTDRLEEEKRRGMSIDIGFAYADFGLESPIGFVDVPGHERFVRNMLAGVAAIDCALVVIAADDGPMPQTHEHLAILGLLGVKSAIVALTKIDRVDRLRVLEVRREIRALLAHTEMREAPILPVVATTGEGVVELRDCLKEVARVHGLKAVVGGKADPTASKDSFRLAVDRVFTLPGAGLVVSGAVFSGCAQVGDRVFVSPAGVEARIRSIHAQSQQTQFARIGQRCALNLSGVDIKKDMLTRGDWVLAERLHAPTQRLDVELILLASEPRLLVDDTLVQVHLAAASVPARVALLRSRTLAPGQTGLAQLVLDKPISALHGDRFVLRDQAAQRTIGGGRVLDPFGLSRGRAKPLRLRELEAMTCETADEVIIQLLDVKSEGLDLEVFECAWNLGESERRRIRALPELHLVVDPKQTLVVSRAHWLTLKQSLLHSLADAHQLQPDRLGLSENALIALSLKSMRVQGKSTSVLARSSLRSLIDTHVIVRDGLLLRMPEHQVRLTEKDQTLLERVSRILLGADLRPPIVGELAKALEVDPTMLLTFLQRVSHTGHLEAVASNRFYLPQTIQKLLAIARDLAAQTPEQGFDAAAYRDQSGIGRNSTIQVLEFFDRHGYTRFARNRRWMQDGLSYTQVDQ